MVLGLLDTQNDAMIDMIQPVNRLHPANRGLVAWWMVLLGTSGGRRFMDIYNPGPNGLHGTLTNMDPATDFVPSSRLGSYGELDLDGVDDYIDFGDSQSTGITTGDISVFLWVFITNSQGNDNFVGRGAFSNGRLLHEIINAPEKSIIQTMHHV